MLILDLPPPPPPYECVQEASDSVLQLTVSGEPEQMASFLRSVTESDQGWRIAADAVSNGVRFARLHNAGDSTFRVVGVTIYSAQRHRLSVALNSDPPICSMEDGSVVGWSTATDERPAVGVESGRAGSLIDMPDPQQVIGQLGECGIEASAIRTEYADDLQSDIVIIDRTTPPLSEQDMECVRNAVPAWYAYVQFENEATEAAFRRSTDASSRREGRMAAQQWLEAHGLLTTLPMYRTEDQSIEQYAERLEEHCSIRPGTALQVYSAGLLTLKSSYLESPSPPSFECLWNAVQASNIEEHGVSFGFVGNEQIKPSSE